MKKRRERMNGFISNTKLELCFVVLCVDDGALFVLLLSSNWTRPRSSSWVLKKWVVGFLP